MRKLTGLALLALAVSFGCGSGEETTISTPPAATSTPAASAMAKVNNHGTKTFTTQNVSTELEMDNEGNEYYFEPTFIKLPGGSTVKLELKNEGSVEHNFTVTDLDIAQDVEPGKTMDVTVKIGTATRYDFFCKYHKALGMQGAFLAH